MGWAGLGDPRVLDRGQGREDDWQVGSRSRQQEGLGRRTGDSREVLKNNPT